MQKSCSFGVGGYPTGAHEFYVGVSQATSNPGGDYELDVHVVRKVGAPLLYKDDIGVPVP